MATGRSMGKSASSVGMMEGAFFVSRGELLQWVNDLLSVNLTKVEQCASGAIYCQILDACHPQQVAMQKVNWMARVDHEFIPNYKVLQAAFERLRIERHIAVELLIRAKYQDNLEFLQWMKCYWDREGQCGDDYDPCERRLNKQTPAWARAGGPGSAGVEKENRRPVRPATDPKRSVVGAARPRPPSPGAQASAPQTRPAGGRAASAGRAKVGSVAVDSTILKKKLAEQSEEMEEMRCSMDGLEKERDYYFKRLSEVETLCTALQTQMDPDLTAEKLVADVLDILYTEDADEGAMDGCVVEQSH